MALTDNPFIGLPIAQIQELQQLYLQVLVDIAKVGRSYAFPGLSMTKADLEQVNETLRQLRIALEYGNGQIKQIAYATIDTQNQFSPENFRP